MSSMQKNMKDEVLSIMKLMAEKLNEEVSVDKRTYNDQRTLICQLFNATSSKAYNVGSIMLRLTVIDSLYATNAAYSYFSIEEMAQRIVDLGSETETCQHFANYALQKEDDDVRALFDEPFGIRKNLADGSKQVSLLSKYAYYCLVQQGDKYPMGFPIYDSLAKDIYPKLWKKLLPKEKMKGSDSMENYIEDLSKICNSLFEEGNTIYGMQQFDLLDAYLWRMGKFSNGNLSLLLERDNYVQFIKNLELQANTTIGKDGKIEFELLPKYAERMGKKYNGKHLIGKKRINISDNPNTVNVDDLVLCEFLEGTKNPFAGLKEEDALRSIYKHWKENYGCIDSSAGVSESKPMPKPIPINDTLTVASIAETFKLNLTAGTTVEALGKEFNDAFGAQLRVYNGNKKTEPAETLGSLGLTANGAFECRSSLTVGSFIEHMLQNHGLKVKVYTCDWWVAVLDGLTLKAAGMVKKNAVKADMESMIAYQRSDGEPAPATPAPAMPAQVKKSATHKDYTIVVMKDNKVVVGKGDDFFDNTKAALREIAGEVGFQFDTNWTTQQLGSKLVDFLNSK